MERRVRPYETGKGTMAESHSQYIGLSPISADNQHRAQINGMRIAWMALAGVALTRIVLAGMAGEIGRSPID